MTDLLSNRRTFSFLSCLAFVGLGVACDDAPVRQRCAECGMFVDASPRWRAGLGEEAFDAPKCLFRWARRQGRNAREAGWVIEYYTQTRREAGAVLYVAGSDVLSPMGDDLVPIASRERAERFARDHGGRVLDWGAIDDALLRSLDP